MCIGKHVFLLGLGGSSVYACFYSRHALKNQSLRDTYTPGDQKPFDIIDRDTLFGRRDYCPVSVDQSYNSDYSVAILTGD